MNDVIFMACSIAFTLFVVFLSLGSIRNIMKEYNRPVGSRNKFTVFGSIMVILASLIVVITISLLVVIKFIS